MSVACWMGRSVEAGACLALSIGGLVSFSSSLAVHKSTGKSVSPPLQMLGLSCTARKKGRVLEKGKVKRCWKLRFLLSSLPGDSGPSNNVITASREGAGLPARGWSIASEHAQVLRSTQSDESKSAPGFYSPRLVFSLSKQDVLLN
jgi:hypothetical protein